jgi:serine/threonine protein kinase
MLFPKAECNLREYLKLYPAPAQDATHVSWLFKQLFDLTDAVDQIHIMSPQEPEGPDSDNLRTTPPRKSGGFHHDLKPDNILAFKDPETGLFVLRITDFGVARLDFAIASKSRNQDSQTRSNRGDPVYGAPDYSVQNHLGRKADIWSLGCCFLEILMWNFGFGGEKLEDFRLARYREPTSSMGVIAAFWYFNEDDNTVALKPAVTEMLEKLQRICSGKGQFRTLVQWIEFMLTLKQKERPKASEVRSAFKAMHQEVEANLHKDKEFYMKVLPTGGSKTTTTFAPVTEIYATSSRDDSIDGRKVPAPYGVSHPATPAAAGKHQRSSSGPSLRAPQSHVRTSSAETTQSGGQFLSPSVDDVYTNGRPRAPSIEVSEPTVGPGPRAQSILSGLYEPPTRDEIPTLRRKGSGSSKSQTL